VDANDEGGHVMSGLTRTEQTACLNLARQILSGYRLDLEERRAEQVILAEVIATTVAVHLETLEHRRLP
jgi:hypothetical protein